MTALWEAMTPGQSVSFAGVDGPSDHTVAVQVTDNGGLTAVAQSTVHILNVPPTVVAPTASPEPSTEGSAVTASASFTDPAGSLDAPFTCTVDYGDGSGAKAGTVSAWTCTGPAHTYATFGSYTVTVAVTDKDGGIGSRAASHVVVYAFSGFFSPVDAPPTVNSMKAGAAVPIKFSLGGDKGLAILAAGYPTSQKVVCDAGAPVDGIEETSTAGSSGLACDAATGQYRYIWKTDKAWAGTCRAFTLKLVDGTSHIAYFRFTK